MLSKAEALSELAEMGSHAIVSIEWAQKIGAPFGVTFVPVDYRRDPNNPKGPMSDVDGASDTHVIAARICDALGIERRSFFGRGSQFRSDVEQAREAVTDA